MDHQQIHKGKAKPQQAFKIKEKLARALPLLLPVVLTKALLRVVIVIKIIMVGIVPIDPSTG